mmetsp:Transcript_101204/g.325143  ORF Transcript_101204/g.325143 Transcript_101204/m.325143 type:complete len:209 (-) Transcript_101204:327-953(-)
MPKLFKFAHYAVAIPGFSVSQATSQGDLAATPSSTNSSASASSLFTARAATRTTETSAKTTRSFTTMALQCVGGRTTASPSPLSASGVMMSTRSRRAMPLKMGMMTLKPSKKQAGRSSTCERSVAQPKRNWEKGAWNPKVTSAAVRFGRSFNILREPLMMACGVLPWRQAGGEDAEYFEKPCKDRAILKMIERPSVTAGHAKSSPQKP